MTKGKLSDMKHVWTTNELTSSLIYWLQLLVVIWLRNECFKSDPVLKTVENEKEMAYQFK